MILKNFKLEVKSVDDDGTFTGYASVTGNIDSDNEVIDKGAFKRTLDHTKGVVPILWQHDRSTPVGWNVSGIEDGFGLAVSGKLMIDTEAGRYAQSFLKTGLEVGAKPGLSIGFTVPKDSTYVKDGVKHFKEVALKEYSIVTFQANLEAVATGAKAEGQTKRVAGEDLTADCFAYIGDPEDTSTWKLPIKFSTEEKTVSHLRNALARFGATQGIPESEKAAVLAKIKHAAKEHGIDTGDKAAKDVQRASIKQELQGARGNIYADTDMDDAAKSAALRAAYATYGEKMADHDMQRMAAGKPFNQKSEKGGRAISQATADQLAKAVDHIKAAGEMHAKAIGVLTDLSHRSYTANDVNAPNPVGPGANPQPYAGWNPAGGGKADTSAEETEKSESEKNGDSELLHSLLNLTRSVADRLKAA
jgi:hypothetical protein